MLLCQGTAKESSDQITTPKSENSQVWALAGHQNIRIKCTTPSTQKPYSNVLKDARAWHSFQLLLFRQKCNAVIVPEGLHINEQIQLNGQGILKKPHLPGLLSSPQSV